MKHTDIKVRDHEKVGWGNEHPSIVIFEWLARIIKKIKTKKYYQVEAYDGTPIKRFRWKWKAKRYCKYGLHTYYNIRKVKCNKNNKGDITC